MVRTGLIWFAIFSGIVFSSGAASGQNRIVELEILANQGGELGNQQEWMEALEEVGADRVRIKSLRNPGDPAIEEVQSGSTAVIRVTGVIAGNELAVPGARYSRRDIAGIAAYVQKLRDDGSQVALAEKKAFGLTSEQLVSLHQDLSAVVGESTKDKPAEQFVAGVLESLAKPISVSAGAMSELKRAGKIADELRGLSAGTALAAAIRPAGLVLVPKREQGKTIELTIVKSADADEHWPIGWPSDRPVSQAEPKLFQRRDIEIRGFVLRDAITAVAGIVEVPVLYDWNSLATKEVDPDSALVTFVRNKAPYYMTIVEILRQTKPMLSVELRLDENGKPFMWIY